MRNVYWIGGGKSFSSTEEAVEFSNEMKRRIKMTKARRSTIENRKYIRGWEMVLEAMTKEFGYQTIRPND